MSSSLLEVSAHAAALLQFAARGASGRVTMGDRTLVLQSGLLNDVLPADEDESFEQFLIQSGRVSEADIALYQRAAEGAHTDLGVLLVEHGATTAAELRHVRRAILIDRMTRALRRAGERHEPPPTLAASEDLRTDPESMPLLPLLLDAMTRSSATSDAIVVGKSLDHRIEWLPQAQHVAAVQWANFGEVPERPAVSTVLAKRPAAAPRIAALLRAGLARLTPPGGSAYSKPPPPDTLPPPAPRNDPLGPDARSLRPLPPDPLPRLASVRPPRIRLAPGEPEVRALPLEPTALPTQPRPTLTLDDPVWEIEARIAALEARSAPGQERARAFRSLAAVWHGRFLSTERACIAFREAVTADPEDTTLLQQAAAHCHALGQQALATRYAQAAVLAASLPVERAAAEHLRATIERAAGNLDGCIEALCEAASDDTSNAASHEQVATLLLERGDLDGSNAHARLAAASLEDEDVPRGLALLAWASNLKPHDLATTYEYASLLVASGRVIAAATILAEAATRATDVGVRRKLRLAAAERAEAAGRGDVAAEYLEAAFDAEPHLDFLYKPLQEDISRLGSSEYRSALLEDIASACPGDQRSHWLTAAGDALVGAEHQQEASLWLYFEALLNDATNPVPLAALRTHARTRRGLTLLAHGLRAAIAARLGHDDAQAAAWLRELADLGEFRLHNRHLALAAWVQLEQLADPATAAEATSAVDRLTSWVEGRRAELERAEIAFDAGEPDERAALGQRVARLLPDLPEHWPRIVQLLSAALAAGIEPIATRETLETLHGLRRDANALATFLEQQAGAGIERDERLRILLRLSAVRALSEDTRGVATVCENLLALDPECRGAIARLIRAARKLDDPRRLAHALAAEAKVATQPLARGRALAQLARAEELCAQYAGCAQHAAEALRFDPSAVDAGFILLRHVHRIDTQSALVGLDALLASTGGSRALDASRVHVAEAAGDDARAEAAAEHWVALLPSDVAAHRTRIAARSRRDDAPAILEAAEAALAASSAPEIFDAALEALDRLQTLEAHSEAAQLALRIGEQRGRIDPPLALLGVMLARRSGSTELATRALEFRAAIVPETQRADALLELAAHHRERSDTVAEVRALLRVVECEPNHSQSLDRLRVVFSHAGDGARLLAVLELQLAAEREPSRRQSQLLHLASIASRMLQDTERAERYLRTIVAENSESMERVRGALGALLSVGEPTWAIGRAQAIAEDCPEALGERIYLWCAVTAELRMGDPALALDIAARGALRFRAPAQLLLMVERLTLSSDDVGSAMQTYDGLMKTALGRHGRHALLYRAARWLERSGRLDQALDRYLDAFEISPAGGAALGAIERVARQTGRLERLVACYERLAEVMREDSAKLGVLCKASELCLDGLGERQRGFDLLLRANACSDHFELDDRLEATARQLLALDAHAGTDAVTRLTHELSLRVDRMFSGEDKARCHVRLLRLYQAAGIDDARVDAHIDAVLGLAASEGLPVELVADAHLARASARLHSGHAPEARVALSKALSIAPGHRNALSLAMEFEQRFPSVHPNRQERREVAPAEPLAEISSATAKALAEARSPLPSRAPTQNVHASAATLSSAEQPLHDMREQLRAEPWRTDLLRKLAESYSPGSHPSEAHVVRDLLSIFDSSVPRPTGPEFHSGLWRGTTLRDAIGDAYPPAVARFLSMLWEYCRVIPRFRKALGSFGISERDRITRITLGPVAEAYAHAARVLGTTEVQVYVSLTNNAPARPLPTHPPSVLAGRGVALDQVSLVYAMARALWLAQPEHVIGGVLPPEDAMQLLLGAELAFAPQSLARQPSAAEKELAAALWQSVPMREQRQMTDAMRDHRELLQYPALRANTRSTAARAALLTAGSVSASVRVLATSETELGGLDLATEQDFCTACNRSPALAETVRCALSDTYLRTLAKLL